MKKITWLTVGLPTVLLAVALSACRQEEAPPPGDGVSAGESFMQAQMLAECEVAYTVQAQVIHGNNETESRKYRDLAREAHLAATVALALDWNTRKKRSLQFYSDMVDSWTKVKFEWWDVSLDGAAKDGGSQMLVLLDVYHTPAMTDCAGLRDLQHQLAGMVGQGDLK